MRITSLCLVSVMSVLLAGCQSNGDVKVAKLPAGTTPESVVQPAGTISMTAPEQTMLSLGRGMSGGSVDIYEPGVATLDVPTIETFTPRPSPVPENNGIVVRDPSVTVYSLDAVPGAIAMDYAPSGAAPTALTPMPEPAAEPRRYASDLTPTDIKGTAMPGLQPPIVAQGDFSSPFSPNGTLR